MADRRTEILNSLVGETALNDTSTALDLGAYTGLGTFLVALEASPDDQTFTVAEIREMVRGMQRIVLDTAAVQGRDIRPVVGLFDTLEQMFGGSISE